MYKLYQFAMPPTAKAKNLLLITQNLIFSKINISAKTLLPYYITLQMSAVGERGWVGATPPRQTVGGVNQSLCCHLVTATQQTRDVETMLA